MGRLSDAEHMYRRSLSAWEESVGKGHPALAEPLIRLAALYLENGMADRAERLVGRLHSAMNTRTPSDPDTPSLLHILAAVHHAQRRYAEAEPLYREALESTEKSFGPNDYRLLRLLDNLGLLLGQMGRPVEAVPYLERALLISEKALGPTHPNVARSLANLGSLYSAIGRYTNAEPLFLRAEAIAASNSGAESRLLGQVLAEYAVLLHKTGRRNESKALKSRAQAIRRSSAREDLGRHTVDFRDLIPSRNNG
jgi:tetratricopeptide (TPR) repeat protein